MRDLRKGNYNSKSAQLLNAMSNEHRLRVLRLLAENGGEFQVSEIAKKFELSQSALSQHLSKLRRAAVVRTRRDAQKIYYSLSSEAVVALLKTLDTIFHASSPSPSPTQSKTPVEP